MSSVVSLVILLLAFGIASSVASYAWYSHRKMTQELLRTISTLESKRPKTLNALEDAMDALATELATVQRKADNAYSRTQSNRQRINQMKGIEPEREDALGVDGSASGASSPVRIPGRTI